MNKTRVSCLAILAALSGCASITNAGFAGVEVKRDASGHCTLTMQDGKEYTGRTVLFDGGACTLAVQEAGAKAFKGQALATKALTVLPVTDLANIVGK